MPRAWRIVRAEHFETALSGNGARRWGGRWNSPGRAAVYASESLALAMLEVLVHLDVSLPGADYVALELDIPEPGPHTIDPQRLPKGWPSRASLPITQNMGDFFLNSDRCLCFKVPSAVVRVEHNYVLNPEHPDFLAWSIKQHSKPAMKVSFNPRRNQDRFFGVNLLGFHNSN